MSDAPADEGTISSWTVVKRFRRSRGRASAADAAADAAAAAPVDAAAAAAPVDAAAAPVSVDAAASPASVDAAAAAPVSVDAAAAAAPVDAEAAPASVDAAAAATAPVDAAAAASVDAEATDAAAAAAPVDAETTDAAAAAEELGAEPGPAPLLPLPAIDTAAPAADAVATEEPVPLEAMAPAPVSAIDTAAPAADALATDEPAPLVAMSPAPVSAIDAEAPAADALATDEPAPLVAMSPAPVSAIDAEAPAADALATDEPAPLVAMAPAPVSSIDAEAPATDALATEEPVAADAAPTPWALAPSEEPVLRATSAPEFAGSLVKSIRWSPDGTCFLTNSEDNIVRVFESHHADSLAAAIRLAHGETVYDHCWYPAMDSAVAVSCCFLTTCRDHPIKLWDAYNGTLRATYRAHDRADEVTAALSLCFAPDGGTFYAGFDRTVRVFDITRPGRDCHLRPTAGTRRERTGLRGLVSCIAASPDRSLYACGTFLGQVGLFGEPDGGLAGILQAHAGGVTQVQFAPDGARLFAGARRDPAIACWDVRQSTEPLFSCERASAATNQARRIAFDLDPAGRTLVTGGQARWPLDWADVIEDSRQDGRVRVFDATTGAPLAVYASLHGGQCIGGVSLHPRAPALATGSGERVFTPSADGIAPDARVWGLALAPEAT